MKEIIFTATSVQHAREKHGIELSDIATAIYAGGVLDILETHRPTQYAGQLRYIVQMDQECYVVPCVETATHIRLITAWRSRAFRKRYLD